MERDNPFLREYIDASVERQTRITEINDIYNNMVSGLESIEFQVFLSETLDRSLSPDIEYPFESGLTEPIRPDNACDYALSTGSYDTFTDTNGTTFGTRVLRLIEENHVYYFIGVVREDGSAITYSDFPIRISVTKGKVELIGGQIYEQASEGSTQKEKQNAYKGDVIDDITVSDGDDAKKDIEVHMTILREFKRAIDQLGSVDAE